MQAYFGFTRSATQSCGVSSLFPEWRLPAKPAILAAAAILALTAGGASAGNRHPVQSFPGAKMNPLAVPCAYAIPPYCVYDQNNSPDGYFVNSQNFTSGTYTSGNDAAADDFVFYANTTVHGIDVTGQYLKGNGPATSVNVTFYADASGYPGSVIASYPNQPYTTVGGPGNFQIELQVCKANKKGQVKCKPKPVKFKGNKKKPPVYWVSVVANCSLSGGCGVWVWDTRSPIVNNGAVWEQPAWTPSCSTWTRLSSPTCLNYLPDDFMFDLW